jgi:hypothetical protein
MVLVGPRQRDGLLLQNTRGLRQGERGRCIENPLYSGLSAMAQEPLGSRRKSPRSGVAARRAGATHRYVNSREPCGRSGCINNPWYIGRERASVSGGAQTP